MKNVVWANFGFFPARRDPTDFLSRLVTMDETWLYHYNLETKQQSVEWRHSGSPLPAPQITSVKSTGKFLACLDFFGSRRHPAYWLSSKGRIYHRGVLFISAGAIERHFEGKTVTPRVVHQLGLVLARQCPGSPGTSTLQRLAYLCFQCLDHPPYSPDLAPSDYHLFPGLKKQLKGRHFSSHAKVIAAAETWLDGQTSEFFCDLQKLE